MKPRQSQRGLILLCAIASLWLSACNENSSGQAQSVADDWVNADADATLPVPSNTPKPAPSASPLPNPTTTPTSDLYTGPTELEKYVAKFVADAQIQGTNVLPGMKNPKLQIQIATITGYGSSTIGLCETGGNLRRVTLSPSFWNSTSETQRELLMHHELGHCVLYRPHRSDTLGNGAYASIMYPIIMSSSTYANNYDYYQEELFGNASLQSNGAEVSNVHICDLNDL